MKYLRQGDIHTAKEVKEAGEELKQKDLSRFINVFNTYLKSTLEESIECGKTSARLCCRDLMEAYEINSLSIYSDEFQNVMAGIVSELQELGYKVKVQKDRFIREDEKDKYNYEYVDIDWRGAE